MTLIKVYLNGLRCKDFDVEDGVITIKKHVPMMVKKNGIKAFLSRVFGKLLKRADIYRKGMRSDISIFYIYE